MGLDAPGGGVQYGSHSQTVAVQFGLSSGPSTQGLAQKLAFVLSPQSIPG